MLSLGSAKTLSYSVVLAIAAQFAAANAAAPAPELRSAGTTATREDDGQRALYIVRFSEAPLALYDGQNPQFPMPERELNGRLNASGGSSQMYVNHLLQEQNAALNQIEAQIGRDLEPRFRYTRAINGVALSLSEAEATYLRSRGDIASVQMSIDHEIDTDVGPTFIGANGLWTGASTLGGQTKGDGIVVGIIDSGINFDSLAFAATETSTGFVHVNPLGANKYLGTCDTGGVDAGQCSAKVIGAYDFVYTVVCTPASPTTDPCRTPGGSLVEEPSVEDNNGHGSHTASTVAGIAHNAVYAGGSIAVSGVAPHAHIIAYDVCYLEVSTGRGLCPTASSVAAVEQVIADGLVDVINFSIGGGSDPWNDSVSQAFLSASNAGVFVAASAGNSGPGANTMGHHEPWTTSVAAMTHSRGTFVYQGQINDAGSILASASYNFLPRAEGTTYAGQFAAPGVQIKMSPALTAAATTGTIANDMCNTAVGSVPAGHFTGTVALVRRGTCGFGEKAANAIARGASGVIIFNNSGSTDSNGFPNVTLTPNASAPVWTASTANGDAIFAYIKGNANTTRVAMQSLVGTAASVADSVASFSSRGPNPLAVLKPDIGAPGVNILAAYNGNSTSYNIISGTSMASPHVAGSAALMRALNPSWSPLETKSALMMVAKTSGLTKENGTTASDPFDRGAGRVDLSRAAKVGLVLHETGANFTAANPANGGNPSRLNLASFQDGSCIGVCQFQRTVRAARAGAVTYTLSVSGLPAGAGSVSPTSFSINTSGTRSFTLSVDSSLLSTTAYSFGELVLTPSNPSFETLRMPIAVRAGLPEIELTPNSLTGVIIDSGTTTVNLAVKNLGNPGLTYTARTTGSAPVTFVNQPYEFSGTGFRSSLFTDTPTTSQYASDDFAVPAGGLTLSRILAEGFNVAGSLSASASALSVFVFPDAGGVPAGDPSQSPENALFSYQTTVTGTGVSVAGNAISIDLTAAGQTWTLPEGTYWLVVRAHLTFANRWVWYANSTLYGQPATAISVGATPPGNTWGPLSSGFQSLAMRLDKAETCGASWITAVSNQSGTLGLGQTANVQLTLDATGLGEGNYRGFVCVDSNDSDEALTVVPVVMSVRSSSLIIFRGTFEN